MPEMLYVLLGKKQQTTMNKATRQTDTDDTYRKTC